MHDSEHNCKWSTPRTIVINFPMLCLFPKKEAACFNTFGLSKWLKCKKVYGRDGTNFLTGLLLAVLEPSCRFNICLVARQYGQHAGNKCNFGSKQGLYHYRLPDTYRKVIQERIQYANKRIKSREKHITL